MTNAFVIFWNIVNVRRETNIQLLLDTDYRRYNTISPEILNGIFFCCSLQYTRSALRISLYMLAYNLFLFITLQYDWLICLRLISISCTGWVYKLCIPYVVLDTFMIRCASPPPPAEIKPCRHLPKHQVERFS